MVNGQRNFLDRSIPSNEQNLRPMRVQVKPNMLSRFPLGHCNFRTLSRPNQDLLIIVLQCQSRLLRLYLSYVIFVLLFIVGVFIYAMNCGPPPECLVGE